MDRIITLTLALTGLLVAAGPVWANGGEVVAPGEQSWAKPTPESPVETPAMKLNLERTPAETVTLEPFRPPCDRGSARTGQDKGPLEIGVHREMPRVSPEQWRVIAAGPDQYVLRLVIHSPGAVAIRPHFASFPPAAKAQVFVYGQGFAAAEGPLVKPEVAPGPDFWGPPLDGEYYYIECVFPGKDEAEPPVVDEISHIYKGS